MVFRYGLQVNLLGPQTLWSVNYHQYKGDDIILNKTCFASISCKGKTGLAVITHCGCIILGAGITTWWSKTQWHYYSHINGYNHLPCSWKCLSSKKNRESWCSNNFCDYILACMGSSITAAKLGLEWNIVEPPWATSSLKWPPNQNPDWFLHQSNCY